MASKILNTLAAIGLVLSLYNDADAKQVKGTAKQATKTTQVKKEMPGKIPFEQTIPQNARESLEHKVTREEKIRQLFVFDFLMQDRLHEISFDIDSALFEITEEMLPEKARAFFARKKALEGK